MTMQLTFTEQLLCPKHCPKSFLQIMKWKCYTFSFTVEETDLKMLLYNTECHLRCVSLWEKNGKGFQMEGKMTQVETRDTLAV